MKAKVILITLLIFFTILILIPFIFKLAGINLLQFGAAGSVFGGDNKILLRSEDGGKTFEEIDKFNISEGDTLPKKILDFTFHPRNPEVIFLGTKGNGLWKSTDSGASWKKIIDKKNNLKPEADIYKIYIADERTELMYAAAYQDKQGLLFKSENAGESFKTIYFVTEKNFPVRDIYVYSGDPKSVIIITEQGGLLKTFDGGETWQVLKWFQEPLAELHVNPKYPVEMYLVTKKGQLLKSFDGGLSWSDLQKNLKKVKSNMGLKRRSPEPFSFINPATRSRLVTELTPSPHEFTLLYAGSKEGVLRSHSGGFSWENMALLIPPNLLPINSIAIHPNQPNNIFVAAANQIHHSVDNGVNWNASILKTSSTIKEILIHPARPVIMFAILD